MHKYDVLGKNTQKVQKHKKHEKHKNTKKKRDRADDRKKNVQTKKHEKKIK